MCWASAPGCSPAIVATTCRGRSEESSAHSATAPFERSQPSRAARRSTSSGSRSSRPRSSSRNEPRRFCSTSSRASSTATSVRHATAATCRNSSASGRRLVLAEQQHGAELLVAGGDRDLRDHARRHSRRAAARPLADVAAQRARDPRRGRTPPPRRGAERRSPPRRRSRRRRGRPRPPGRRRRAPHPPCADARRAAAPSLWPRGSGWASIATFNTPPSHAGRLGEPPRASAVRVSAATRSPERRPRGGPAGSLRRTRPCESGKPPRPAG